MNKFTNRVKSSFFPVSFGEKILWILLFFLVVIHSMYLCSIYPLGQMSAREQITMVLLFLLFWCFNIGIILFSKHFCMKHNAMFFFCNLATVLILLSAAYCQIRWGTEMGFDAGKRAYADYVLNKISFWGSGMGNSHMDRFISVHTPDLIGVQLIEGLGWSGGIVLLTIYTFMPIISLGYEWRQNTYPLVACISFTPLVMAGVNFCCFLGVLPFRALPLAFLHEHCMGECVIMGVLMAHTNINKNKLK